MPEKCSWCGHDKFVEKISVVICEKCRRSFMHRGFYGDWRAFGDAFKDSSGYERISCLCRCGAVKSVLVSHLLRGNTKSCGCRRYSAARKRLTKHGHSFAGQETKEYRAWMKMHDRCRNKNNKFYRHYGGRGVSVCDSWGEFENFISDMGPAPANTSLDRIDVNGDYDPENCRWATSIEQQRNRRNNFIVEFNGERAPLSYFCTKLNLKYSVVYSRLKYLKMPIDKALYSGKYKPGSKK